MPENDFETIVSNHDSSAPLVLQWVEAEKIYKSIFGQALPGQVRDRFIAASLQIFADRDAKELNDYYNAIAAASDLEALEIGCRYRRIMPLLTLKFNLMVFLAETMPSNQKYFVNEDASFSRGLYCLIAASFRSCYKMCKGLYLSWALSHA